MERGIPSGTLLIMLCGLRSDARMSLLSAHATFQRLMFRWANSPSGLSGQFSREAASTKYLSKSSPIRQEQDGMSSTKSAPRVQKQSPFDCRSNESHPGQCDVKI